MNVLCCFIPSCVLVIALLHWAGVSWSGLICGFGGLFFFFSGESVLL